MFRFSVLASALLCFESLLARVAPKLDIALVIDDSGSMTEEQFRLQETFPEFMSQLGSLDWRLAVTTTTENSIEGHCKKLDKLFTKRDKDFFASWKSYFNQEITALGSSAEAGIYKARELLRGDCLSGWRRKSAALAVIFVTDEDNCDERECLDEMKDVELLNNFINEKTILKLGVNARYFGLLSTEASHCSNEISSEYQNQIERSGGMHAPVCGSKTDYNDFFTRAAKLINSYSTTRP
jgi:hypothetical protein